MLLVVVFAGNQCSRKFLAVASDASLSVAGLYVHTKFLINVLIFFFISTPSYLQPEIMTNRSIGVDNELTVRGKIKFVPWQG